MPADDVWAITTVCHMLDTCDLVGRPALSPIVQRPVQTLAISTSALTFALTARKRLVAQMRTPQLGLIIALHS